jgi:peptide/nickel transport system permease protein
MSKTPAPSEGHTLTPSVNREAQASGGYWAKVVVRFKRDKVSLVCAAVILLMILVSAFAHLIAPMDPYATSIVRRLHPIGTPGHFLGTDELGRDMLSRLIYGGRLSLLMGIMPVVLALVVGTTLGLMAGYFGGGVNTAIMRIIDVFYAFPSVLLAIAISGTLGSGPANAILALTITFIPPITRVAESMATKVRSLDFIEAARASGAGHLAIIRVHALRNIFGPVFVYATSLVSVSVVLASGLSFLGLGIQSPEPEWGLMLSTLRQTIYVNPWVAALPGTMIFITSMCFNLMSDGLRSAMDVRLEEP